MWITTVSVELNSYAAASCVEEEGSYVIEGRGHTTEPANPQQTPVKSEMDKGRSNGHSWSWLVAAIGGAVVVFLLIFTRSGSCAEYVSSEAISSCTAEPIIGFAGAWVVVLPVWFLLPMPSIGVSEESNSTPFTMK
ncbi:MAG: hypothetical protein ACRCSP_08425 [Rhodoglobus sp.]